MFITKSPDFKNFKTTYGMKPLLYSTFIGLCCLLGISTISRAQLSVPQSSPKAKIVQTIGLTDVTINYSRPNVVLDDQDRSGEIWGNLVPWETTPNQMTGRSYPWRAGANENTVFTFSSDVSIEGEPLTAGSYSFHIIPHENGEATLIFNRDDHQWGSFNYDDSLDALRVKITTAEGPPTNLLTYHFTEVSTDAAVCELAWEKKRFPFSIEVNTHEVALDQMRKELGQSTGFMWQNLNTAANYCLDNEVDLEQGLAWVDRGILYFGGNFPLYNTKADILDKMGKEEEAEVLREKALAVGAVRDIFGYGNTLVNSGELEAGFEIMKKNYDKFYALGYEDDLDECMVNLGMAMAYAGKKDLKMALKYGNIGVEKAPPSLKAAAEAFVARLETSSANN